MSSLSPTLLATESWLNCLDRDTWLVCVLSFTMGENMGDPMWSGGENEVVLPQTFTGELLHWAEVGPGFLQFSGVWITLPGVSEAIGEVGD